MLEPCPIKEANICDYQETAAKDQPQPREPNRQHDIDGKIKATYNPKLYWLHVVDPEIHQSVRINGE